MFLTEPLLVRVIQHNLKPTYSSANRFWRRSQWLRFAQASWILMSDNSDSYFSRACCIVGECLRDLLGSEGLVNNTDYSHVDYTIL